MFIGPLEWALRSASKGYASPGDLVAWEASLLSEIARYKGVKRKVPPMMVQLLMLMRNVIRLRSQKARIYRRSDRCQSGPNRMFEGKGGAESEIDPANGKKGKGEVFFRHGRVGRLMLLLII